MNLIALAGSLARTAEFQAWVGQYTVPPRTVGADDAAEFIRVVCEVESRRELATHPEAADRFERFIRRLYVAWRDRQHSHIATTCT